MKNFKTYLACLTMVAMLFTSCSKEENTLGDDPANKATLTFGAYLNDLVANKAALKQAITALPDCSDDLPVYVEVVLSQGGSPVVGTVADPLRVTVNPNPQDYDEDGVDEYFTDESASLELDPGTYILEYFTVLNADEEVIWVSPIDDGEPGNFATYVDNPLPMEISLGAGVKKYVDVEVLCFDNREVNEYGYLFFDLETNAAFEFCFFANYCPPEGRHYPASIQVDIWVGDDDTGVQIYSDVSNVTDVYPNGDAYALPICFALPDLAEFADDEDYLYYEVTLQDWDAEEGGYGDVDSDVISGTLSRNDVVANFDGDDNVDYEHLRFGCPAVPGDDDGDDDDDDGEGDDDNGDGDDDNGDGDDDNGDGDDDDNGDGDDDGEDDDDYDVVNGCETAFMMGDDSFFDMSFKNNRWGWAQNWTTGDGERTFEFWAAAGQNDTTKGVHVGNITVEVDGDEVEFTIDMFGENELSNLHIYLESDEPTKNSPGNYTYKPNATDANFTLDVEDFIANAGFWIIVHGDVCED